MRVRIPASSANLGPGFDCFGLAWQCWNEIEFIPGGDKLKINGCPERFQNRENLAFRGYLAVLEACGLKEEPLSIEFLNSTPSVSPNISSTSCSHSTCFS